MKLEKKFESKNNQLYFINGKEILQSSLAPLNASQLNESSPLPADNSVYYRLDLAWSSVGMDEESYNESMLASLRDWLKLCDEKEIYVFIHPLCDADISSQEKKEAFTASFKHCARRIKDCTSVIGFAVPEEADSEYFMQELSAKHAHYVFFGNADLLENQEIVCEK